MSTWAMPEYFYLIYSESPPLSFIVRDVVENGRASCVGRPVSSFYLEFILCTPYRGVTADFHCQLGPRRFSRSKHSMTRHVQNTSFTAHSLRQCRSFVVLRFIVLSPINRATSGTASGPQCACSLEILALVHRRRRSSVTRPAMVVAPGCLVGRDSKCACCWFSPDELRCF